MAFHELLGKVLAALEHGAGLGGTYHGHAGSTLVGLEVVVDALDQRVFGAYHNHIHTVVGDKLLERLKIIGLDSHILTHTGCTGVSGSDKEVLHFLALSDFPGQGVFATAAS